MIEVVVRNRPVGKGSVFYHEPLLARYTGDLLPNPKHVANDCIVLSGDGFIPYRVIPTRDIVSINGAVVVAVQAPSRARSWSVQGSKGQVYTVTRNANSWACTCVGFQFHKDCKHIREKKNAA